jgi:PBP1b-binding outer membrane lipoprotein LpoB
MQSPFTYRVIEKGGVPTMKKVLFVLAFAAIAFAGCKKEEAVAPEQTPAVTEQPAAPAATDTLTPGATDQQAPAAPVK